MNNVQLQQPHPSRAWVWTLAPVAFVLLWSSGFVFTKMGLAHARPLTFLTVRYACVLAILLPAALWLRPALPSKGRTWLHLAIVGLLVQGGYFALMSLSLGAGMSATGIALVVSQQPILVGLLAPLVTREAVDRMRWLGLALGVAGACLVILSRSGAALEGQVIAWVYAVLALLCMTAGTLWEKRFGIACHPVISNSVQCTVGLALVWALALVFEPGMHVDWTAPGLWWALGYLVLGNSIVAMTLLLAMVRHGEATRVSALFFIIPPATAVIAWVLLGERIAPLGWLGMLLAALGIYLVVRPRGVAVQPR